MPTKEPSDRLFLDTGFVIARFNRRDQFHAAAKALASSIAVSRELWTTDAVLIEICAAFSEPEHRTIAIRLWDQFHADDPRFRAVQASREQLFQAMSLYRERTDKSWSLTDCLSFLVMRKENLTDALATDRHFEQAGFRALLLVGSPG